MVGRVIDISGDSRHLSLDRGFMVIRDKASEVGRVALDDIAVVIMNSYGMTYSNSLLLELLSRKASVVLCGSNHQPAGVLWPIDGHYAQAARMIAQAEASLPFKKRAWQAVVQAKIKHQAAVLRSFGHASAAVDRMAEQVRSGDPDNLEAQAARYYWRSIFGDTFKREPAVGGCNAILNYGYAIVRAATGRAVAASGLHPTLGIHHHNRSNPMCLVDDLMEPFRPYVDAITARLPSNTQAGLTPEIKRTLAALLEMDLVTSAGRTPVVTAIDRLAASYASSLISRKLELDLPLSMLPLDLHGALDRNSDAEWLQNNVDDGDV